MNRFFLLGLTLTLFSTVSAGELDSALARRIGAVSSGEKIKVWIKLPEGVATRQAVRSASSMPSALDRHRLAIANLKEGNGRAQAGVVRALSALVSTGKAAGIKQHWTANVVEAEIEASELTTLAQRSDVELVVEQPDIRLIGPADTGTDQIPMQLTPNAGFYTANLVHIKADQAHTAGYTGKGRVVCSFDTGVLGDHPLLNRNWRGKGGSRADSIASWFDPADHLTAPHIPSTTYASPTAHGTHVMGIMVGRNLAGDSTFGVAPDAKWISAGVIDCYGASILDAFDWAADPDGDPNTLDDVPDVINHSWGEASSWVQCKDIFFEAIDNVEALGIVNIFAAGNSGPVMSTIVNPANRALDSIDCFSVGNLNEFTDTIFASSSRGPSICNLATKPNVMAPGVSILSAYSSNTTTTLSGTSMAAPHVSGLVALLRQKNPSATPAQIKTAILSSTRRKGTWGILPDNNFGWGEIDCVAALNALAASSASAPDLRLYGFAHTAIVPGGTVAGKITLLNLGTAAKNDTVLITGSDPSLTVVDGQATFSKNIAPDSVVTSTDSIKIQISDTVTTGRAISIGMTLIAHDAISNARSTKVVSLMLLVEPPSSKALVTHTANNVGFSLTNFGAYGFGPGSMDPADGVGFTFEGGSNDLYEAGLMLGLDSLTLASGVHDELIEPATDFRPAPGGNMLLNEPGDVASQQTFGKFTDAGSRSPIGLEITQESYEWGPGVDNFVLVRYILKNNSGAKLSNLRFGLYLDWDIISFPKNCGGFDATDSILWTAYNLVRTPFPPPNNFRGALLLDHPPTSAVTDYWNSVAPGILMGPGYGRGAKFGDLARGFATATLHANEQASLYQVLATTRTIGAGASDTVTFALIGGDTYPDLAGSAAAARGAFNQNFARAPLAFAPISPSQSAGSPVITLLPTFTWQRAVDPNPIDSVTYTLKVGADSIFTPATTVTVSGLSDTLFALTDSLTDLTNYWWKVTATDLTGRTTQSSVAAFRTDLASDVNDGGNNLPKRFALYQNFPNPFNPSTVIAFDLPRASDYRLEIFNLLGRTVREFHGHASAGQVRLIWDGSQAGSGVYFYRLTAGAHTASRKMVLLK